MVILDFFYLNPIMAVGDNNSESTENVYLAVEIFDFHSRNCCEGNKVL
jgi:hypothetical protein